MLWVELLFIVGVLVAVAAVAAGYGELMAPARRDAAPIGLPEGGSLGDDDVRRLRFNVVLRGYRMREVDEVLERFAAELRRRDDELAALHAGNTADMTVTPDPTLPAPAPELEPPAQPPTPTLPEEPDYPEPSDPDTPGVPGRPGDLPDVGQPDPRRL